MYPIIIETSEKEFPIASAADLKDVLRKENLDPEFLFLNSNTVEGAPVYKPDILQVGGAGETLAKKMETALGGGRKKTKSITAASKGFGKKTKLFPFNINMPGLLPATVSSPSDLHAVFHGIRKEIASLQSSSNGETLTFNYVDQPVSELTLFAHLLEHGAINKSIELTL